MRGPFVSLAIAITVIFLLIIVFFIFGYKLKRDNIALERQQNYRAQLGLYTAHARGTIERCYRKLASCAPKAFWEAAEQAKAPMEALDGMIEKWR